MNFRTEEKPLRGHEGLLSHGSPILLIGSCFSDNIGGELQADMFDVTVNPFGPLYNPKSILNAVKTLCGESDFHESDIFEHEGWFHHWDFHSRFSALTAAEALKRMKDSIASASKALKNASCVIITLGTTTYYSLTANGRVVANCHKMPGNIFEKENLNLDDAVLTLNEIVDRLFHFKPEIKCIFTISPLRYISDGLHANTIIKSTLQLAADSVVSSRENCIYFPAFEIMTDDLRDYRFYADDMKHPSDVAVRYIYELFQKSFFTERTASLAAEGRRLYKRLAHRSLSSNQAYSIKELEIIEQYPELRAGFEKNFKQ